jgi:CheY-like chemotaxis protein
MHKTIDILLIDDCDADSKITFAAARQAAPSASLVRVKDGEQALRLMFHQGLFTNAPHVPRLIVLELNVPRTSGYGVLRRLRAETVTERVPVIVLTSNHDRRALEESYELGARECLVKPNDTDEYLSEVSRAVQRHLTPSPAGRGLG